MRTRNAWVGARMSEKVEKVLTRLGHIWAKRIDDDAIGEWLAEWESALKPYEAWVIDAAATRMIHSRVKDKFPVPRELIDICNEVVADDKRTKPRLDVTPGQGNPFKLAHELMQCELGRRAAREGWALTLRDFIVRNGRLPQGEIEVKKLITIRDQFQQNLIDCIDGNGGLMGRSLANLGRSMAKREYEIAQRVLGSGAEDWYATRL